MLPYDNLDVEYGNVLNLRRKFWEFPYVLEGVRHSNSPSRENIESTVTPSPGNIRRGGLSPPLAPGGEFL